MAKRRGNPNWGKPEPIGPIVPTITEFEQVVREYKLSPDQYLRSTRLREWARRNKNSKYIPEPLLEAWGFEIESTLYTKHRQGLEVWIELVEYSRVARKSGPLYLPQLSVASCQWSVRAHRLSFARLRANPAG